MMKLVDGLRSLEQAKAEPKPLKRAIANRDTFYIQMIKAITLIVTIQVRIGHRPL